MPSSQTSRQYRWQQKTLAGGGCISCGHPKLPSSDRCFRHYVMRVMRRAGLKPQNQVMGRNRDYLITWLRGMYIEARVFGEARPDLTTEALGKWEASRFTHLKSGAARFARVALSVERRARKDRNASTDE